MSKNAVTRLHSAARPQDGDTDGGDKLSTYLFICWGIRGSYASNETMLPSLLYITVDATNVRGVFVTSCRINTVYVRGDATTVRVHSLDQKDKHCGMSFIETIIFLSLL